MENRFGNGEFLSSDGPDGINPAPEDSAAAARVAGASIAERRAAKFGFNAVKISTARFRTASPMASPAARSPCLTIPPGISPTALLDSPIMLHNSLALPSPTTGTFPLPPYRLENSIPNLANGEDGAKGNGVEYSKFKPYLDQKSLLGGSTFGNQEAEAANQAVVLDQQCSGFEFPSEFPGDAATDYCGDPSNGAKFSSNIILDAKPVNMKLSTDVISEQSLSREPIHGEENAIHDILEGNHGAYNTYGAVARTSEDGYNWRKYGQKQVKGSEYPRSYYKCTHPNCQVKKKVERSHDGQITEIIYKGAHNHVKPQLNRRPTLGSALSLDEMSEVSEGSGTCLKVEGGSTWTNIQSGSDVKIGSDGRSDGIEITSSASILTELSDPFSTTHGKSMGTIESTETPELSSTIASHDDDEDGATQGSMSLGGDADDEESESKRRKKESCLVEAALTSRAVREPRVVVQIESDVDILDDGYRWRKYGQKVVKGNPNPRSYYKCTSAGCSVRKHVERASHNLKCVITTYEGKHNHEVPAARNGNHMNSRGSNATQSAAGNAQPALGLPRNSMLPKSETQIQDFPPHFDRKPEFGTEYLRPGFPGTFSNDVRFGPPPVYQMKFPPLQSTLPYATFGLNPNRFAPQQASQIASVLPDFLMPMPSNLPPPGNIPMAGFDFNSGNPGAPIQALPSGQQHLQPNDLRFLRPKQEQNNDVAYDPCLPIVDQGANAPALSSFSSSSPAYNRVMGNFPP